MLRTTNPNFSTATASRCTADRPSTRAIGAFAGAFMATTILIVPVHAETVREDLTVASEPGIDLFVRRITDTDADEDRGPVLLLHGARVGGLGSFDIDVENLSLAEALASEGHAVYVADLRGYGRSSFPPAMNGERFAAPPAVPTDEAVADVKAVLDEIERRHPDAEIGALGWATGSHWLAATESVHPGSIDRLVFYNSVYGGDGEWRLTANFAVEGEPATFDYEKFGAYRTSDAESLTGSWTDAPGVTQAVIDRCVELAMEGDPTATDRDPPSFRHPSGPIADTLRAVNDAPLYDAGTIRSNVLLLRSGDDFWSRPVDYAMMKADLTGAATVVERELPGASHYVHLEPGERRDRFLDVVTDFLADGTLDVTVGQ